MQTRALLTAALAGLPAAAQTQVQLDYPALLARLTDPGWLASPPLPGERCVQFSSYDRASKRGSADHEAWYANGDRGQYLRVEERDGQREYVMAEVDGPGVLARIWSANPQGLLHFDIDGQRVWSVEFAALTGGKVEPVVEPLAGLRSRGANCHLPIPFGKRLKLSQTVGDSYYQVNVLTWPQGAQVPSFSPALLAEHGPAIAAAAAALRAPAVPAPLRSSVRGPGSSLQVPSGQVVRRLSLTPRLAGGDGLGDALRQVLLVVRCGREETVRVPVADFFNGAPDWRPHAGALLGITAEGTGYCNLPMPMPEGGEITTVVDGRAPGLDLALELLATEGTPADALLFRAAWHQRKAVATRPFHDHRVLDARGRGRFVGCSLLVKNPVKGWWGEGDEKFYVDGEAFPSTFGTGTEDYFGYAWCSPQPFSSAFHAQPQCDGPGNYGFTALHRIQLLDGVPFQQSFRFDLEVWHWVERIQMDYATVAYWYGAPGATAGLPAVPPAAERTLDRLPPYPMFVAKDALEGESLRVLGCTGGQHEVQDLGSTQGFSREAHRWWRHGKVGDRLTLAVPVEAAGNYRVRAQFCTAADYGIVRLTLAGQQLGEPLDLHHDGVAPSGERDLGTVSLPGGEAELVLEIVGSNPKAAPGHMAGLDYLRLEPVR